MKLRLITLSEDRASGLDFIGQTGLSILVESDEANILFDTGQGMSASYNADALGIDLKIIDKIVLSHGHFDHTGGLHEVLRRVRKRDVEIIAHPDIWKSKHIRIPERAMDRFVGLPFQRAELERLGARFRLSKKPTKISENISTTGEIPMRTQFEKLSSNVLVEEGTELIPDEVLDDQALMINTRYGLIIILGCSHRGAINTIYHAQKLSGVEKVHMVLGGCHLIGPDSKPRIEATIDALIKLDVQKIGLCHCTGLAGSVQLAQTFQDRFFFNNAGSITVVE
jgi:7,8-dihydropterin-6-yl-methyl-4-(beta-D-ribofuranosyl)aminobenzene 5'-phosphate synthase